MNILQRAAWSILESDRAKSDEFGGGKFSRVHDVDVVGGEEEPAEVVLHVSGGETVRAVVLPHSINRPKERAMTPADVHDAVRDAMKSAYGELSQQLVA